MHSMIACFLNTALFFLNNACASWMCSEILDQRSKVCDQYDLITYFYWPMLH